MRGLLGVENVKRLIAGQIIDLCWIERVHVKARHLQRLGPDGDAELGELPPPHLPISLTLAGRTHHVNRLERKRAVRMGGSRGRRANSGWCGLRRSWGFL